MKLVIVESPTKAKTISKFLDKSYVVKSSYGHVRDLPKSTLGVDTDNDFEPKYVIPPRAKLRIAELKKDVGKAETVILATDEDREGEAIAWHLAQALDLGEVKNQKSPKESLRDPTRQAKIKNIERIVFHEITKPAIERALAHPRDIIMNLVNAQQARRVLDRLVGYKLSPFLWRKVLRGLSAGRVQSVAVRLIVDREREIEKFHPEEYWTIETEIATKNGREFTATLQGIESRALAKFGIKNQKEAEVIAQDLKGATCKILKVEKKEFRKNPLPPFTTSTLQQEAVNHLRFSAKQTMMLAQKLYEGVEIGKEGSVGLITYMRTDSVNLADAAIEQMEKFVKETFGPDYSSPRKHKTKSKLAQEAHEAIRPTDANRRPEDLKNHLDPQMLKLYQLIWSRALASQMKEAVFDTVVADTQAGNDKIYTLRSRGQTLKFDGFLKVYPTKTKELTLPDLKENEEVDIKKVSPNQHFTEPPPRYSEATLVKTLEEFGIGRPSTYAPIISTIQERGYVTTNQDKRFQPTEIGVVVNDLLVKHFPNVVDVGFTAAMEEDLDKVAEGKKEWRKIIVQFYEPFQKNLEEKEKEISKKDLTEKTDEVCEKCGKNMIIRFGRYGKFLACSGFPECKNTRPLKNEEKSSGGVNSTPRDETKAPDCDKCGAKMKLRQGRYGEFWGCSSYPQCQNIKDVFGDLNLICPGCQKGKIVKKISKFKKKIFYGCDNYPECKFAVWDRPTGEICPACKGLIIENKTGGKQCAGCGEALN